MCMVVASCMECCGFDNATDWITRNPDVVVAVGLPPGGVVCTTPGQRLRQHFNNGGMGKEGE